MKRLLVLCLLLAPGVAMALDTTPHPVRVGILRDAGRSGRERDVQAAVLRYLRDELQHQGFDAVDTGLTFDAAHDSLVAADYFVEVVAAGGESDNWGGVGVGGDHAGVSLDVVVSHVAAEVRLYDGVTLELIDRYDLSRRSTALLPTSIGLGGRDFYAVLALPFVEWAQNRSVARAAAREAAKQIASSLPPP